MKKVALLTIFMLVFTLASFAQVDVTVTGKSELTLGIALDDPIASGFTNTNECKIAFTLAEGTAEKGGEEAVYGWIEIKEWSVKGEHKHDTDEEGDTWKFDSGDVTAKIMFSGGWVKISGTNNSINFINPVQDDDGDKDNDDKGVNAEVSKSGGLVLGLDLAPAAIELGIFSANDWKNEDNSEDIVWGLVDDDDDNSTADVIGEEKAAKADTDIANTDHAYGVHAKITLDVAPLKVEVGAVMGIGYPATSPIGVGGKVTADVAPITIYAGGDVKLVDGADPSMEFGGGISVEAMDGVTLAVDGTYSDTDNTDVKVSVTEDGAGGAVPALGASVAFELYELLVDGADPEWAVDATLDYTTDTAKPYVGVRYGTFTEKDDSYTYKDENPFKLNVGVELYVIENVTLKLDYNSDDLTTADKSNGEFKIVTTISY